MTQAVDARLALIINEFGDVGVDGAIAKACGAESCDADSIIELAMAVSVARWRMIFCLVWKPY